MRLNRWHLWLLKKSANKMFFNDRRTVPYSGRTECYRDQLVAEGYLKQHRYQPHKSLIFYTFSVTPKGYELLARFGWMRPTRVLA